MSNLLEPTANPEWVLNHEGYNILTENEVESRFAFGNGFLPPRRGVPLGPAEQSS